MPVENEHDSVPMNNHGPGLDETDEKSRSEIVRVSGNSRATAVAGAIAGIIRERRTAQVQAIGAGAVNQAVKALAIARSYLEVDDLEVIYQPDFVDVEINGQERTAIRFNVHMRDEIDSPSS